MGTNAIKPGAAGEAVRVNTRHLRLAQRLTTTALSEKLSAIGRPILATGITRIEKGARRVDVDDLVALAAVLGVQPERLLAPFECETCHGDPPAGFACRTCGAEGGVE